MSSKQLLSGTAHGYVGAHHLRIEKHVPESLNVLRRELELPQHRDIWEAARKGATFEDCIGIIAAHLDIALDGDYEADDLFSVLIQALRNRGTVCNAAHELAGGLVAAELVERANDVTLEFGGATLAPEPAKEAEAASSRATAQHSRFMQEAGCDICESREACQKAARCLGAESYEAGQQLEERKE